MMESTVLQPNVNGVSMHRRTSSKDQHIPTATREAPPPPNRAPARTRVNSTPSPPNLNGLAPPPTFNPPPSAGPMRTTFGLNNRASTFNGLVHPPSPLRASFSTSTSQTRAKTLPSASHHGHTRNQSISAPFSPPLRSPLSSTFPKPRRQSFVPSTSTPTITIPDLSDDTLPVASTNGNRPPPSPSAASNTRHSRSGSGLFTRPPPLSLQSPITHIAEDETPPETTPEYPVDEEAPLATTASSANDGKLHTGFTFGGRPPGSAALPAQTQSRNNTEPQVPMTAPLNRPTRRGHHHKHSVSHNFFSFLEPGANIPSSNPSKEDLQAQPAPTPSSPWGPLSSFPQTANPPTASFGQASASLRTGLLSSFPHLEHDEDDVGHPGALGFSLSQFALGAWIWGSGQHTGSLTCTGLGYWIVFDAIGVWLTGVVPGWLQRDAKRKVLRRMYGYQRVETLFMFAHAVYLLFASVYLCKETVEHSMLHAGKGEGHHHHHGDEDEFGGIDFPIWLVLASLFMAYGSAFFFNTHSKLLSITNNRIPPLGIFLKSFLNRYPQSQKQFYPNPTTRFAEICLNPYNAAPLGFALSMLFVAGFVSPENHRSFDLLISAGLTFITARLAYKACVVLGGVLLQTSPSRGESGGRMEALLKAMKEIERHPQVLHLPAPHMWQLAPFQTLPQAKTNDLPPKVVVTLELHVRKDLPTNDVLELTHWAWERCVNALHFGIAGKGGEAEGQVESEVTVGIVRG